MRQLTQKGKAWVCSLCIVWLCAMCVAAGAEEGTGNVELTELSLETLLTIQVVTATRSDQPLFKTASAVHVLTEEDIRRSPAATLPDLLRTVPGVNVAQLNANTWAVSTRGFNQRYAAKLLVLRDGMTIYSPTFSGVYWDVRDIMLEDVERIEIIRGPGAAVWGANAVNGIINIITKTPADTQGELLTATGGTAGGSAAVRHGAAPREDLTYRVWAKGLNRTETELEDGSGAGDDWKGVHGGVRAEWVPSPSDTVTVIAEGFAGRVGQETHIPGVLPGAPLYQYQDEYDDTYRGGNALVRWERDFGDGVVLSLQTYFDGLTQDRRFGGGPFGPEQQMDETYCTLDFDSLLQVPWGRRHEFVMGLGYRSTWDRLKGSPGWVASISPTTAQRSLYSGFVQDTIQVWEDKAALILGFKVERNDYTGFEVQPSARMLWTPDERYTFWAAASRAVRTPSRIESDSVMLRQPVVGPTEFGAMLAEAFGGQIPDAPIVPALVGNKDMDSEKLLAFEAGFRMQPVDAFSLDVALFYNIYDDLLAFSPTFFQIDPGYLVAGFEVTNAGEAESHGVEVAASWDVTDWWRLDGSYAYMFMDLDTSSGQGANRFVDGAEQHPRHQASVQSAWDLPCDLEFDVVARYVDPHKFQDVPHYLELDGRLGWNPSEEFRIALKGRNLLHGGRNEFKDRLVFLTNAETQRSVQAEIHWRF